MSGATKRSGWSVPPRVLLRGLVLIVTLVAVGYGVKAAGLDGLLDEGWIDDRVRGHGLAGELLLIAVGAVTTAVGLPKQLVAFLAGYAFGFAEGTAVALAAAVLGCICAFAYARLLGRDLVAAKFPNRIRRVDAFLRDNPMSTTLAIRLLPVGNNLATNLVAGVSSVRPVPFVVGSAIGYLPQTMAFALAGSGVHLEPVSRFAIAAALLVGSAMLGVRLYRRYRGGRSFDTAIDQALDDDGVAVAADSQGAVPRR